jgi:hypothetical protein
MAENVEDPIEASALHQDKLSLHDGKEDDGQSILRVVSRKSTRGGEEVKWTEEVHQLGNLRKSANSSETIVGVEGEDRGTLFVWRVSSLFQVRLHSISMTP